MAKKGRCDGRNVKGNRGIGGGSDGAKTSSNKPATTGGGYKTVKRH